MRKEKPQNFLWKNYREMRKKYVKYKQNTEKKILNEYKNMQTYENKNAYFNFKLMT